MSKLSAKCRTGWRAGGTAHASTQYHGSRGGGGKFLLFALGLAALVAAAIALDLARPASAQSDEQSGRIVARLLDDGRVEFGWQPTGGARILPEKRYFPASIDHNRWLRSSPVEVGGAEIGRINARQSEDGRIEFAFTPSGGERILTDARYFPTDARPNRWLRSTEITISAGPIPFVAVSAGGFHTCGLRQSGAIECWGNNTLGQTDAPAGTFTAVMADYNHNCAIRDTGEVECWGYNEYVTDPGGDGRERQTIETGRTDAPDGSYTAVDMGTYHTCAIRTGSGEIECWGLSEVVYGIRTDTGGTEVVSFEYELTDAPAGSFTAVSAGWAHTCAIAETFATTDSATDTGEIECWGVSEGDQHYYGQTDAPAGRFRAISAGHSHTCAIRDDGTIECWGRNAYGLTDAPAGSFTAVSANTGGSITCAIRTSGEIACWGVATYGLTDVPAGSYTVISISRHHICGLRTNGAITCWGANHDGESDAPEGSFTAVSAGAGSLHTCAIRDTGAITCWGHNNDGQATPPTD